MVKREDNYLFISTTGDKPIKIYFPKVNKERIEALKEYYNTHDISIVRNSDTGNLEAVVRPV
jgi:hypothetical protein